MSAYKYFDFFVGLLLSISLFGCGSGSSPIDKSSSGADVLSHETDDLSGEDLQSVDEKMDVNKEPKDVANPYVADTDTPTKDSGKGIDYDADEVAKNGAPYPASKLISDLVFDWDTHRREAQGSDNFQLTWAHDDNQYGAWGDGGGFGGGNSKGRVSLGVARVEKDWHNYVGKNMWGGVDPVGTQKPFVGKSWGMIAVNKKLYMWATSDHGPGHLKEVWLSVSSDNGESWQKKFSFNHSEGVAIPTFLNFGKNNNGARDNYVYSYFIKPATTNTKRLITQKPGALFLARVPKSKIENRASYEFFIGNSPSDLRWGSIEQKKPVFQDKRGTGWCLSAIHVPSLNRYLLATEHDISHKGYIGVFEAPRPWGPWRTVKYYLDENYFGKNNVEQNVFYLSFAPKWFDNESGEFSIIFTGGGQGKNNDSFNSLRGKFALYD